MSKCLNCNTDIVSVGGKRAKVYCSDKCRIACGRKSEQTKSEHSITEQANPNKFESEYFNPNPQQPGLTVNNLLAARDNALNLIAKLDAIKFGSPDCQCKHCQANRATGNKQIINHGTPKPIWALAEREVNRVSLPGDVDYTKKPEDLLGPAHLHAWRVA